ncbi:MAG: FMN-binding protein [Clostridiales bacterium]|nr:FMN-binding protein [Clostridiales bacterium]
MSKRAMFLRMITASLLRRRSRMLIALLSIAIGATILAGLVTVYVDVPRQMAAQFRSYGANMILMPAEGAALTVDAAKAAQAVIPEGSLVGAAPYRYVYLNMVKRQQTFAAAATDFTQVQRTSPYFKVDGAYPQGARQVLVGKHVAETIGVKENSVVELTWFPPSAETAGRQAPDDIDIEPGMTLSGQAPGYGQQAGFNDNPVYVVVTIGEDGAIASLTVDTSSESEGIGTQCSQEDFTAQFIGKPPRGLALHRDVDAVSGATVTSAAVVEAVNAAVPVAEGDAPLTPRTANFTVAGILETGGEEEDYIYMSLSDMADITGQGDLMDLAELSVSASQDDLQRYAEEITASGHATARLVKRVTKSETAVLGKLQALVFLVTAVVLVLTMVSVSTTMMAVVAERRREIGLRKALGASDGAIRAEFLGEGLFLGALGGLLGAGLGFLFAQVVSVNVFGSDIRFNFWLLPITVLVSMLVAAMSCLLPVRRAVAIDPALVLKGE